MLESFDLDHILLNMNLRFFSSYVYITVFARFEICIEFENSPTAAGLQWLKKEQTAGKRQPYLFSQFQSIYARTVLPCQDTPAVKHPYRAKVCTLKS